MKGIFERLRQYNSWNGIHFNRGYIRHDYLNRFNNYLGNKLVKVFVGQRRTGKSYLLRQLIAHLIDEKGVAQKNIFYFNKELPGMASIKNNEDLDDLFQYYLSEIKPKGKIYLFLDEIQNVSSWEVFVNAYSQDFTTDYELFITGSNSNMLSGELSTHLSGRYVVFDIYPFSFSEYADYLNLPKNKDSFLTYLQSGGLPELFHLQSDELKTHYIESLRDTIILRDIVNRKSIKDVVLLEDILRFLISNIGNMTSLPSLVKYFKNEQKQTNYETLSSYVSFLCETFVVHRVDRYQIKGKQSVGGVRKYYLNDLSFKNYLFGFFADDLGYNLENFVYLQLKSLGYKVSVGIWDKKEIDFVAESKDYTCYIQVAYVIAEQKTAEREYGNLLAIKDNFDKFIVTLDDVKFTNYQGIKHLFPWELAEVIPHV